MSTQDETSPIPAEPAATRPARRMAPVLAGMLVDAVDFMTMGPIGLYGGFLIGGAVTAWAARQVGLSGRSVWIAGVAGAVYAATPATEFIPLGTLIGLTMQLLTPRPQRTPGPQRTPRPRR